MSNSTIFVANIASVNTSGIFSNGEVVFQSNGTANVFVGTVLSTPQTIVNIPYTANVILLPNTVVYQQNSSSVNTAVGVVSEVISNSAANNITIYIGNTTGIFSNSANIVGLNTATLYFGNTIQKAFLTGITNAYSGTGSLVAGEGFTGTGVSGSVVYATDSEIYLSTASGTLTSNMSISGNSSFATAVLNNITNKIPANNITLYQKIITLTISNAVGSFTAGEVVYQRRPTANTSNTLLFVNTAFGRVVSANNTKLIIDNEIGGIIKRDILYGETSGASAKIQSIFNSKTAKVKVISNTDSNVVVANLTGLLVQGRHIYGNNYFGNLYSFTLSNSTIPASNVISTINTLTIKKISGSPNTSLSLRGNTNSTNCTIVTTTQERY